MASGGGWVRKEGPEELYLSKPGTSTKTEGDHKAPSTLLRPETLVRGGFVNREPFGIVCKPEERAMRILRDQVEMLKKADPLERGTSVGKVSNALPSVKRGFKARTRKNL